MVVSSCCQVVVVVVEFFVYKLQCFLAIQYISIFSQTFYQDLNSARIDFSAVYFVKIWLRRFVDIFKCHIALSKRITVSDYEFLSSPQ